MAWTQNVKNSRMGEWVETSVPVNADWTSDIVWMPAGAKRIVFCKFIDAGTVVNSDNLLSANMYTRYGSTEYQTGALNFHSLSSFTGNLNNSGGLNANNKTHYELVEWTSPMSGLSIGALPYYEIGVELDYTKGTVSGTATWDFLLQVYLNDE